MLHAIQVPHDWFPGVGNIDMPIPNSRMVCDTVSFFANDTYHRVCEIDEMVTLKIGTWFQYNKLKHTHLTEGINKLSGTQAVVDSNMQSVPMVNSKDLESEFFDSHEMDIPKAVDCHFDDEDIQYYFDAKCDLPKRNDPFRFHDLLADLTSVVCINQAAVEQFQHKSKIGNEANVTTTRAMSVPETKNTGLFAKVCAFMALGNDDGKKPITFDTGASLAITPDKSDFDGPLSIPSGDLRLGGMANELRIEGMGTVTWTFTNIDGTQVRIQGLSYYVPGAKARLLSPQ